MNHHNRQINALIQPFNFLTTSKTITVIVIQNKIFSTTKNDKSDSTNKLAIASNRIPKNNQ